MRVVAVCVGLPREVSWNGKTVRTGIFKEPVDGRIGVGALHLEGDGQADLSVHGGRDKAVYGAPSEHYPSWREDLPGIDLPWGAFGENLTTEGLLEESLHIGDRLRVGTAELVVTQPRLPCFKLGLRLGRPDVVKRLLAAGRCGFYFKVAREGELGAGDAIERVFDDPLAIPVSDVLALATGGGSPEAMRRVAHHPDLAEVWQTEFRKRLSDR